MATDFPASAAASLIEGYSTDFVQFSATLAQTLEQISMRGLKIESCRESLDRMERGMRDMAAAIAALLGHEVAAPAPPAGRPVPKLPPPPPPARPAAAAPAKAAAEPEPTGGLHGTSETMPLTSVFQFLTRMRKSGTLKVVVAGETMTFEFVGGNVESSTTDRMPPSERIGDILVRQGVPRERIEPVLERCKSAPSKLGNVLLRERIVTNGQLMEALERQVTMRFHRAIHARSASYEFHEGDRIPGDGRIRIRATELLYASRQLGGPGA